MPTWRRGMDSLRNYLSTHLKYPKSAQDKGIQGRLLIQFIVDKNGKIVNPKCMKLLGEKPEEVLSGYDETIAKVKTDKERQWYTECKQGCQDLIDMCVGVVMAMPRWTPAKKGKKKVASQFILPITMRLE